MAKYRKKPVIIEASVYQDGMEDYYRCHAYESWNRDICTFNCGNGKEYRNECKSHKRALPYIKTLEGEHMISKGDYIITGVKGEKYPCKPDIFHQTYELVNE